MAEEGARRPDLALDLMEEAREGRRPVVLYVATSSDDRRMQRQAEACLEMEQSLFRNYQVASRLAQHFTLIRVNLEDVEGDAIRRYRANHRLAPQVVVYDSQLNLLNTFSGRFQATRIARALDDAVERNDALLERLDRRSSR